MTDKTQQRSSGSCLNVRVSNGIKWHLAAGLITVAHDVTSKGSARSLLSLISY